MSTFFSRFLLLAAAGTFTVAAQPGGNMATGSPLHKRDIYVTGRLVLPDGLPPSDMIPVLFECPEQTRAVYSDLRGEFRIRVAVNPGTESDLSSLRSTYNCAVIVNIPGFQTASANVGNRDPQGGIDVGPMTLKPLTKSEGTLVSLESLSAPELARKEVMKSREEAQHQKWDAAARRLEKAIGIFPGYATAWYELGRAQERMGDRARATESYRKASEIDPKYLGPQIQMAALAAAEQRWDEAEMRAAKVIKLGAQGLPGVYMVHAVACYNQKKFPEAEKSAREGFTQDLAGQFPKLASLLGTLLESRGETKGAAEAFAKYLERAPKAPDADKIRERLARLNGQ